MKGLIALWASKSPEAVVCDHHKQLHTQSDKLYSLVLGVL
jgi:hypothetical protein